MGRVVAGANQPPDVMTLRRLYRECLRLGLLGNRLTLV